MAKEDLSNYSGNELIAKKKTLTRALVVMGVLALLYLSYYVFLFAADRYESDRHLLGVVPLFALLAIAVSTLSSRSKLNRELEQRSTAQGQDETDVDGMN